MIDHPPTQTRTCTKHGAFEAKAIAASMYSMCPTCAAQVEQERMDRERHAAERERRHRQSQFMYASGVVGRYLEAGFDNFVASTPAQTEVLQACREFAANLHRRDGGGLLLMGPPGTGKTHLGAAMVRHVITEHVRPASITTVARIIRRLRATWRKGADETEEEVINDLAGNALLVLDEVGSSFGSDAEKIQIFEIVDLRYAHRLPTVLMSNLGAAALKDVLGDRSFDRLREGARALVLDWPSYRGRPAAE